MSIISLIDNGSFSSFKSIIVIGGTLHQKLNSRVQWFNKDLNHHKRESYFFLDTPCIVEPIGREYDIGITHSIIHVAQFFFTMLKQIRRTIWA